MLRLHSLVMYLAAVAAAGAGAGADYPYRVANADGVYFEWGGGEAGVRGRATITADIGNKAYLRMAQAEAEENARRRILKAMEDLRIDETTRLADRPELLVTIRKQLEGLTSPKVDTSRGYVDALLVYPWRGEGGLVSLVLPERPAATADGTVVDESAEPAAGGEEEPQFTGLVVDARHLTGEARLVPALLPSLVDPEGRVLYGPGTPDPGFAIESGLASYQIRVPEPARGRGSEPPPARSRRQGPRPLEVTAVGASGQARTRIVVSAQDARRIEEASAAGFLSEARVVILMPPPPPPPPRTAPRRGAGERPPANRPAGEHRR